MISGSGTVLFLRKFRFCSFFRNVAHGSAGDRPKLENCKKDCSFLKKRTKKLLLFCVCCRLGPRSRSKVFCFFFSKKKTFLS